MKNTKKFLTGLVAAALLLASCGATTNAKSIGTLNNKEILIPYFDEIFTEEADSSTENNSSSVVEESTTTAEDTAADATDEDTVTYSPDTATLIGVMSEVFTTTGNDKINTRKLNRAISNLRVQYGDEYLTQAETTYQLPIKNEKDLIRILKFSLMYSGYLENQMEITDEEISEKYFESYAKKYCASHILVEKEADAKKIQKNINDGTKSFEDYEALAREEMEKSATDSGQEYTGEEKLNVTDGTIDGIKVKEFADLDCQTSSNFPPEFKVQIDTMGPDSITEAPVKTENGYHIIKVTDIEEEDLTKELQDEIRSTIVQQIQQTPGFQGHQFLKLINEVEIELTNEEAKKAFDDYLESLEEDAKNYTGDDEETTSNNEESSSTVNTEKSSKNEESTKNN